MNGTILKNAAMPRRLQANFGNNMKTPLIEIDFLLFGHGFSRSMKLIF